MRSEINGIVCAADSSGNNAASAIREQYSRMPIRMPHVTANRKPTVPSNSVTSVAGHRVGHVSTVACVISLGGGDHRGWHVPQSHPCLPYDKQCDDGDQRWNTTLRHTE